MGDADELVASTGSRPRSRSTPARATVTCGGATTYGGSPRRSTRTGSRSRSSPRCRTSASPARSPPPPTAPATRTATSPRPSSRSSWSRPAGDVVTLRRGDDGFAGAVVHLGALGRGDARDPGRAPAVPVRQRVFEGLAWEALSSTSTRSSRAATASASSPAGATPSTRSGSSGAGRTTPAPAELFGARAATVERHPIIELDPVNCTAQLGRPGPWWDRLPHFRHGLHARAPGTSSSPSSSSAARMRARRSAPSARSARGSRRVLLVSELRTIAADDLWMSPHHGRARSASTSRGGATRRASARCCPRRGRARAVRRAAALGQGVRRAAAPRRTRADDFLGSRRAGSRAAPSATPGARPPSAGEVAPAGRARASPRVDVSRSRSRADAGRRGAPASRACARSWGGERSTVAVGDLAAIDSEPRTELDDRARHAVRAARRGAAGRRPRAST